MSQCVCGGVAPVGSQTVWVIQVIDIEDFCLADTRGDWVSREVSAEGSKLFFANAILVMTASGECFAFMDQHVRLDDLLKATLLQLAA